ncbi:hypothetical protein EV681_2668 [Advenella incenata]|uniref:Uncharacterized protein n=1 Tax=Advenella incenata TaxID=267800 RepID=A0A4Q7VEA6_9BURK|nr:hypothetical protein [Advenella incenata]RZT94250.1 hypothetical protein EV681_2668 [Advenella incenata]
MRNFFIILGIAFALYVFLIARISIRRKISERQTDPQPTRSADFHLEKNNLSDCPIDPLPVINARTLDDNGETLLKWRSPPVNGVDTVNIYGRVSDDPINAVLLATVSAESNTEGFYYHNRRGKPCWYWISVVYSDGQESEKLFAGSQGMVR